MAKKQPYAVFVDETFRRKIKAGEKNVNKVDLFRELGPVWSGLSDESKQYYKDKAKNCTSSWAPKNDHSPAFSLQTGQSTSTTQTQIKDDNKLDTTSRMNVETSQEVNPLAVVSRKRPHEDDELSTTSNSLVEPPRKKIVPGIPNAKNLKNNNGKLVELYKRYSRSELFDILRRCESIVEARQDELETKPLYCISVNIMCKETQKSENALQLGEPNSYLSQFDYIYYPLEIAVCAYSLKQGRIGKPFWTLINAGKPPVTQNSASLEHQKKHKIIHPPMPCGYSSFARNDYLTVYKELLDYTSEGERVLLVSDYKLIPQVKGSLEWLYKKAVEGTSANLRIPKSTTWTVLPIAEYVERMHTSLYQKLGRDIPKFGLPYYIKMKVESSSLDYNEGFMCPYHEKEEYVCSVCAQLCAIKAFTNIGDLFEEMYDIIEALKYKEKETKLALESSKETETKLALGSTRETETKLALKPTKEKDLLAITQGGSS